MEEICMAILKKATEMEQMGEILIIAEQLRLRLHEDKIIKDRRHRLSTYPNCLVASEAITWLIDRKEAADRTIAVQMMQKLIDHNHIHHIIDELKEFKDAKIYYRFRKDDGTFPLELEVRVFLRGQRICEKILSTENSLLQAREEDGVKYERSFVASEFIDWLIQEQESKTRNDAEQLGRRLLEHAVIQHVSSKYHFVDSNLLYQFRVNFRRRRKMMELLVKRPQTMVDSQDSPFCLRKQSQSFNAESPKTLSSLRSTIGSSSSSGYLSSSPIFSNRASEEPYIPRTVLKRPVTLDELLAPGAPYRRKTITVISDVVGWGFVVRGHKPCHIQAVDPSGPAAAAGVKMRQFVVSVNGLNVLHMDFTAIKNHILNGPRAIILEVMEEINP